MCKSAFRSYPVFAIIPAILLIAGCGGNQTITSPQAGAQRLPVATPSPTPSPTPAPTPAASPTPTPSPAPTSVPAVDHVFLVVLENHGFAQVIGNPAMPYLNSLAAQQSLATQYYANTHPSIGNYFMLTAGNLETNNDAFTGTVTDDNIVRALLAAGKTWKAYVQSLPSPGYLGPDVYPYLKHHNPFAYFSDVVNSSVLADNIVPFSQLSTDLSFGSLPQFNYLLPDAEHDAHDCPKGGSLCPDSDKLAAADNWLKAHLAPLISNPALANSLFIVVFDEALDIDVTHGGGRVAAVIAGAHVKPAFKSTTLYQHQSTLRLILELLAVADRPGLSSTAPDMGEFF